MDKEIAEKILALVMKWQEKTYWKIAYDAAESFREARKKSGECHAIARKMREQGQAGSELFTNSAEMDSEHAEFSHRQVIVTHQEFLDIENLLRAHSPTLLEFVPQVNFFDPPDADQTAKIRDLRKLEGEIRLMCQQPKPAALSRPTTDDVAAEATNKERGSTSGKTQTMSAQARAVAYVIDQKNPDLTYEQIGMAVGANPTYLKDRSMVQLKAAIAMVKDSAATHTPRRGSKSEGVADAVDGDGVDTDEIDARNRWSEK